MAVLSKAFPNFNTNAPAFEEDAGADRARLIDAWLVIRRRAPRGTAVIRRSSSGRRTRRPLRVVVPAVCGSGPHVGWHTG
jgi:hypothetical protein